MVKVTIEMDTKNGVEKKELECKYFAGVALSDIPELSHIPCLRGYQTECISMGSGVTDGKVTDALAVSVMQIIEGLAEEPEKKKRLKMKFLERAAQTALGIKDERSGVVILGGN